MVTTIVTGLLITLLVGLLLAACIKIEKVQDEVRREVAARHHDSLDFIDMLQAKHEAYLLRRLADQWDHPSEQGVLSKLAREKYNPGGPSMPAIWLREQANKIDPTLKEEKEA